MPVPVTIGDVNIEALQNLDVPPLDISEATERTIAIFAGLVELTRNASRSVSRRKAVIARRYGLLHLDYRIEIVDTSILVTIWNPFAGERVLHSRTMDMIKHVYEQNLRVGRIIEAHAVSDYQWGARSQPYACSQFSYE